MVGASNPLRVTRISREAARMHSRSGPHSEFLSTANTLAAKATSQCLANVIACSWLLVAMPPVFLRVILGADEAPEYDKI